MKKNLQLPDQCRKHPFLRVACDQDGNVYSLKFNSKKKLNLRRDGYYQVSLVADNKKITSHLVHRLIAQTFIQNNDASRNKINHKNGIKTDNRIENLEWCTQKENIIHARDVLGVKFSASGFQNSNSSFKDTHEVILRNLYLKGFSQKEIIEIMGFSQPTIVTHLRRIIQNEEKIKVW